jgi:hypothetical protein
MNIIEVWKPKYSTGEILVATHKVIKGDNYVRVTQDPTYKGKLLKINLQTRFDYPVKPNGKGQVYCIPISKFEIISE